MLVKADIISSSDAHKSSRVSLTYGDLFVVVDGCPAVIVVSCQPAEKKQKYALITVYECAKFDSLENV